MKKWLLLLTLMMVSCTPPSLAQEDGSLDFTLGQNYIQRAGAFNLYGAKVFNPGIMQEALYTLVAHCLDTDIKIPFTAITFAVADSMTLAVPRDGHPAGSHANALTYDNTQPMLLVFRATHVADVTAITHEFTHVLKPKWRHDENRFYQCIR